MGFNRTDIRSVHVTGQQAADAFFIQADRASHFGQNFMIADIFAIGEMRFEQCQFQCSLFAGFAGPVEQAVRIKCVHHPHILTIAELKVEIAAGVAQPFTIGFALLWRGAIFLRHMLVDILSLGRHVRVQFKCMPGEGEFCSAFKALHRLFEFFIPDDAPGADDIRDNIDGNYRGL
ncbi:hypothetical protein GCM10009096_05600 [Parasphingorhabdus litoris]|uniref:Pentapeptide repeat-containing protein n=1 Tax=Parasphingorhabdus litoris TaxID=394733 RepID=A0ABN1A4X7_9SPHN